MANMVMRICPTNSENKINIRGLLLMFSVSIPSLYRAWPYQFESDCSEFNDYLNTHMIAAK